MRTKQITLTLSLLLLCAAAAAWLVLNPPRANRDAAHSESDSQTSDVEPDRVGQKSNSRVCSAPSLPNAGASDTSTRSTSTPTASREQPQGPKPDAGSPGGPADTRPGSTAPETQPRPLTPAQREEQARVNGGRDAYRARLEASAPNGGRVDASLVKSTKPETWTKQWRDDGIDPPEMLPTPVTGKIMSQQSREGLGGAKVTLLTFFPVNGQRGGSIWPVLTELVADAQGNFAGEVPASPSPPLFYAQAAISVSAEGYRVIAGMPVATFYAGKPNALGIFWAPEMPFGLDCDGTQFEGNLEVVSTGELDPQRWEATKRSVVLATFPHFAMPLGKPDKPQRLARLIGNWDERDTPFVTLMSSGGPIQTKRTVRSKKQSVTSEGQAAQVAEPFEPVLFENSGFAAISGQVVNAEGAGVPNATVATAGDPTSQTTLTDSLGFFYFAQPPKKTAALIAIHDDYVAVGLKDVSPGMTSVRVTFAHRKPLLHFRLRDQLTQQDITSVSVKLYAPRDTNSSNAFPPPFAVLELSSATGEYNIKSDALLEYITLEKVGYFPRKVVNPVNVQGQSPGPWELWLNPGRKLEVRPRDKTAAETADRWFQDDQTPEEPAIWTYWSQHWIEYTIDFGQAPEPGQEGGWFDLVLGCRNQGIVDNNYQFQVKVFVDDVEKLNLTIAANTLTEQFGRASIGQLAGTHRIRLVWQNDSWIPDQLDANIRYQSLKFLEQPGP